MADALVWIERIYGVSGDHIKRDLILAARGGLLRSGVARPILRVLGTHAEAEADADPLPPHSPVIQIITGVGRSADAGALKARRPFTSCSYTWETVGGEDWERGIQITEDDLPMLLTIMVFWASVEALAERKLPQWREPPPMKPPFEYNAAKAQLAGKKVGGGWTNAPTEPASMAFLLKLFDTVPRAAHRRILRELWPIVRRGPRPKRG